jgi:Uma2 family endonuclease
VLDQATAVVDVAAEALARHTGVVVTTATRPRSTLEEYVRLEAHANTKHEFVDGWIFAMAGGTPGHAALAASVIGALSPQLASRRCRVFTSDARVFVGAANVVTYPDVTVVCDRLEMHEVDAMAIVNPTVIVEVLSAGTEEYDRGDKLAYYRSIPSVREVVLVGHGRARIEIVRRLEDGSWTTASFDAGQVARLESIDCDLVVDEVFRDPLA